MNINARDEALRLVEEGLVSPEALLSYCLSWMSSSEVEEMLDANELSERFLEYEYELNS